MTEEELDAAVDVISAVDAGVLQSLNQRIKQRNNSGVGYIRTTKLAVRIDDAQRISPISHFS